MTDINSLTMTDNKEHPEIPTGYYCYTVESREYGPKTDATRLLAEIFGVEDHGLVTLKTQPCPFWGRDESRPEHESGFCRLLGINDWTNHTPLWDQVKECGFNRDRSEDESKCETA
jgi:hypothetical protein